MAEATWITLERTRDERQSAELALVLEARAIEHRRVRGAYGVELQVPEYEYRRAREEISGYEHENAARGKRPAVPELVGRGWPGVAVYTAVLLLAAVGGEQGLFGRDWLAAGGLDAGALLGGEWWRAVTALTLHADLRHLLSNLVFGGFLGYFAARHMGSGLAWAAIVAAGAVGNVANAVLSGADHRSIGASTAVFAALGLLAAFTWRRSRAEGMTTRARVAPLVAGVALLAYTGTAGENTDIGAHLTGFLAGLVPGALLAHAQLRTRPKTQLGWGAAAVALVLVAWLRALGAR